MTATTTDYAMTQGIDRGDISERNLGGLDVVGFILAAIITLGPLAATAIFG
jgi:hypothetical protein